VNKFIKFYHYCLKNKYVRGALLSYSVIFPFLLFRSLELINPASSAGLFSGGIPLLRLVLFSAGIVGLLSIVIYSLSGSIAISHGITSFILLVMYIVNYMKIAATGGVFVPSDVFLVNAAIQVADSSVIGISATLIAGILLVILINIPLYFVKFRLKFKWRIIMLPVTLLFAFVFLTGSIAANHVFPFLRLEQGTISDRYRVQGMLLGFYSELTVAIRPAAFETDIDSLIFESTIFAPIEVPASGADDTRVLPNVIVVMSESFIDPMTVSGITFSQYPVPNFRRLAEESLSGNVLVPVHGGGTISTELEFLTGTPHLFNGSRFYVTAENLDKYFTREMTTALPWLFRQNGYRAVGVHTFYGTFFNRDVIYPLIGFDEFISSEQMPDAVLKGEFISDEYFTDRIIEQIMLAEEDDVPLFLFGISMQNHWEFEAMKYGTLDLDVMSNSPYLSDDILPRVNSFMQGIFDAVKQLGRLIDFVDSRDTPTIVVFFGDHMPILGRHDDRVFENLGFVSASGCYLWTLEDQVNMFQTPYLVWANFDIGQEDWGTMSTFFLGAKVAEASGINLNRYFTYTLRSHEYFRGITNELYISADGAFSRGWAHRYRIHIQALEALWRENNFGNNAFSQSLAELVGR